MGKEAKTAQEKIKRLDRTIPATIISLAGLGILWILGWIILGYINIGLFGCLPLSLSLFGLTSCLHDIPANPPNLALITLRGKRIPYFKEEGLRFFAKFFPILYGFIPVNVQKKNQDMPAEIIRTPDLAVLEIPISITWTPGSPKNMIERETYSEWMERNGNSLINYLNHGGEGKDGEETGVRTILADIVRERVREWAMSPREGPQKFTDALGAQEEAVAILVKAIAGEELQPKIIYNEVPTRILMKYFSSPQILPTEAEEIEWGDNWKYVKEKVKKLPDEGKQLEKDIKKRIENIKTIKRGNGVQDVPQLGITLNRLNIGDINIKSGTALEKAAEQNVAERREKEAEITELEHVRKRIEEYMTAPLNYTREQARDIVQTERNKVQKNIYDIQGLSELGKGIGEGIRQTLRR